MDNTGKTVKPVNTTKVQEEYLAWYESEKKAGLVDIKFFPGDVSQATVDSFIEESNAINRAIELKQCAPIPKTI